jgi:glycosyltransferase involved in cell wall biosynthesis
MSRIVLSFYNLGLGGIQTKMIDLANELVDLGHQVAIVTDLNRYGLIDKSNFFDKRVKILEARNSETSPYFLGMYYYLFLFIYTLFFRSHAIFLSLDETPVTIINFFSYFPFLKKPKIVINVDTFLSSSRKETPERIKNFFNSSDAVIAVSSDTHLDLKSNFHIKDKILHKIYNWVDADNVEEASFHTQKRGIVFAGRFEPQKRPQYMLFFMFFLQRLGTKAKIEMYGTGSLITRLLRLRKKLNLEDSVIIRKTIEDVAPVLKKRKYFLLTSSFEGLPFVVLEAIKYGCVILCLDAPGLRDVVIDGVTGFRKSGLVELAQCYQRLEDDPQLYAQLQRNALSHLKTHFSTKNRDELIELLTTT